MMIIEYLYNLQFYMYNWEYLQGLDIHVSMCRRG